MRAHIIVCNFWFSHSFSQFLLVCQKIERHNFWCRTTKLLSQMRRHLAIICISFLSKNKRLLSQKKPPSSILHRSNCNWFLWLRLNTHQLFGLFCFHFGWAKRRHFTPHKKFKYEMTPLTLWQTKKTGL